MNGQNKLFLDSASIEEAEDCISKGIVCGVTTNPSLFSKQPKGDFIPHCKRLAEVCNGLPLSVEVFCADPNEMFDAAMELIDEIDYGNINIKIPVGFDELAVVKSLSTAGVDVNVTCCYTLQQMILAAKSGARYVSLFYNRARDAGIHVNEVLTDFPSACEEFTDVEIICGSIRKPEDVTDAWEHGSHIVTAGANVIREMTQHQGTTDSTNQFLSDFEKWLK